MTSTSAGLGTRRRLGSPFSPVTISPYGTSPPTYLPGSRRAKAWTPLAICSRRFDFSHSANRPSICSWARPLSVVVSNGWSRHSSPTPRSCSSSWMASRSRRLRARRLTLVNRITSKAWLCAAASTRSNRESPSPDTRSTNTWASSRDQPRRATSARALSSCSSSEVLPSRSCSTVLTLAATAARSGCGGLVIGCAPLATVGASHVEVPAHAPGVLPPPGAHSYTDSLPQHSLTA
jgi:hypothetical protein